ncbi:MAG: hypothetical protein ACI9N1_001551 [Flavobacteriales bacterium]|jgi:hypothetical protein
MKKQLLLLSVFCSAFVSFSQADTLLFEDFESFPTFPIGWSTSTNANTYTGFYVGDTAAANAGNYWDVLDNGSSQFVMTNDDIADDSLDAERLILPVQDFSADSNLCLSFDVYLDKVRGSSRCYVETSIDNGVTWVRIDSVERDWTQWQYRAVDLRSLNYQSNVLISFFWSDGSIIGSPKHSTGVAIDNIAIRHIPTSDLVLHEVYFTSQLNQFRLNDIEHLKLNIVVSNFGSSVIPNGNFTFETISINSSQYYNKDSVLIDLPVVFETDTIQILVDDIDLSASSHLYNSIFSISNAEVDYDLMNNTDSMKYDVTSDFTGKITFDVSSSGSSTNVLFGDTIYHIGTVLDQESAEAVLDDFQCELYYHVPSNVQDGNYQAFEMYYWDTVASGWELLVNVNDLYIDQVLLGNIGFSKLIDDFPYWFDASKYLLVTGTYNTDVVFFTKGNRGHYGTVWAKGLIGQWQLVENGHLPYLGIKSSSYCNLSIEENQINISLAPNPSSGVFNYELESSINGQFQILGINGRIVFEQNISSSMGSLDLSHLDNAVYLLQLIDSGVVVTTEKLVLQK